MSTEYNVGLVVTSRRLSLSELVMRLGRAAQSGSHDKGDLRLGRAPWGITIWRENARDGSAALHVQCSQVLRDIPSACAELMATEPGDVSIRLDIAVFFQSPYVDLAIPSALIGEMSTSGIDLEITAYPCTAEDTAAEGAKS